MKSIVIALAFAATAVLLAPPALAQSAGAAHTSSAALAQPGMKELGQATSIGFKNIALGIEGGDLVLAYPWIDCPGGGGDDRICTLTPKNCFPSSSNFEKCMLSMTYGGVPITSVDFRLFNGRVAMIFVKLESREFDRLKESMMVAFGTPSKIGSTVAYGPSGQIANDFYHWGRPGGQISASRFGDNVGHSSVSIVSAAGANEAERRRRLEIEAGARDL